MSKVRNIIKSPVATLLTVAAILILIVFLITAFWNGISKFILPNTQIGLYNKGFWENFLVEVHGIVFELSIVGVLILWLDSKRNKSNDIQRLKEDLDDYATLDFPEINVKKLGHIKRLNQYNIYNINVQNLILNGLRVKNITTENSRLIGLKVVKGTIVDCQFKSMQMRSSDFQESTIKCSSFENCNLLRSKFNGAACKGIKFSKSTLERADFTNANLQSSIFKDCDLRGIKLQGANLKHASFQNSVHLTAEALSQAKDLDYIKVPEELMNELISLRSGIKYQKNKAGLEGIEPPDSQQTADPHLA
ncbi:pentapeptide repeat-containing protein [Plesiomonas shigelloides]|uniref:pentapeptide repeat-containing protein n=1 Tax=Plesiomonas shigelloides TaxID=703 RepID=UPI00387F1EAC